MKKKFGGKNKKLPQRFLQNAILSLLRKKPGKAYSKGNVAMKLKSKNSKDSIQSALDALVKNKKVITDGYGKYVVHPDHAKPSRHLKTVTLQGRTDLTAGGGAYIIVDGQEKDIYIPPKYVNGALNGDIVEIAAVLHEKGRRPDGKIVRIVERKQTNFIGIFEDFKKYGYVFVDMPRTTLEIRVLPKDFLDAQDGDAVIVEVTHFGDGPQQKILGKIKEILTISDRNEYEMNAILVNNGFEVTFADDVMAESAALPDQISEDEIAKRKDIRDVLTFTIDPHDAKDFDDAISYRHVDNEKVEIGVHIADVTHYVTPGSALDRDAYDRSTSVYLVDRVCPMLPERISNELCSLRPHEDKLCFSVLFYFDKNQKLVDHWIGKTVIHSDRRYTYEEAQQVLDGDSTEMQDELNHINRIAKALNKKRFNEGSINFETDEVRFRLAEDGTPLEIYKKVRKDANKLIEEYMLLANQTVARYMSKKAKPEIPYVYRIHDLPDPDRLMELALLASELGIKLNFDTPSHITKSLNSLSEEGEKSDVLHLLKPMAIRCMAKAAYSSNNIGHYGLGFEYYSHFTSPIRRYADVLAHRILFDNLTKTQRVDKTKLEEQCQHISLKEREAISAERESIKYKQTEYYESKIGESVTGVIRSIIEKGVFIELVESQADGYISIQKFGEAVSMHPGKIKITGLRTGTVWRIGDQIDVIIEDVDLDKRQIDLGLAQNN